MVSIKFGKTLSKNFKLLFRSKASLLALVFGPLVVILLVGLAFNTGDTIQLNIGVIKQDNSKLTNEFIDLLNSKKYLVTEYDSKETCTTEIEMGLNHACIIFPKEFIIENNKTNTITFVVDQSRLNIIFAVIESINEDIGIKTNQLSKDLTNELLWTLQNSTETIDDAINKIITLKASQENAKSSADDIKSDLSKMDLKMISVDVSEITNNVDDVAASAENLYNDALDAINGGTDLIEDLRALGLNENQSAVVDDLEDELNHLNSSIYSDYDVEDKVDDINNILDDTTSNLEAISAKFAKAKTLNEKTIVKINNLKDDIDTIKTKSDDIKAMLESIQERINGIQITSSDNIVNPVNTQIETVAKNANRLNYLFSYLLVLIIMFVGLLLASTLIMLEKQTKASFRTFTTPTKDEYFLWTGFITCFIIIGVQIALLLSFADFFIKGFVGQNIVVNVLLLIFTISFFIMLGMAIGYIFKTQQGANMASITIGTVLLFISNVIFPIETVSPMLKMVAKYNPFVLSSEMIRQSVMFNSTFSQLQYGVYVLLGYSVILLILIILFQKISKNLYFKRIPHIKRKKLNALVDDKFNIKEDTEITCLEDFVFYLSKITNDEYEIDVKNKRKELSQFIKRTLREKKLAKKILHKANRSDLLVFIGEEESKRSKHIIKHNDKLIKNDIYDDKDSDEK